MTHEELEASLLSGGSVHSTGIYRSLLLSPSPSFTYQQSSIASHITIPGSINTTTPTAFITSATMSAQDIPSGEFQDNEYKSRTGQNQIPVQSDDKPIEDPIDGDKADTDAQLGSSSPSNLALGHLTNIIYNRGRR